MAIYRCEVCGYEYDEAVEDTPWEELPEDWKCPRCGVGKDRFTEISSGEAAEKSSRDETSEAPDLEWHPVKQAASLKEGEVRKVEAGGGIFALSRHGGKFGALDNACPHQGGPLGEGSIEGEWLRCPWHGWGFHPQTGACTEGPECDAASHPVREGEDGVFVGLAATAERPRTISDIMAETMVRWGVTHVFGMVGHSNLGLADALRVQEEAGRLTYIGIRHEGAASFAASAFAKLSGRPAACMSIAGPGATNLLTGLWDAKMDRAPILALTGQVQTQILGPGAFQEIDLAAAYAPVAAWSRTVLPQSRHAELMSLALKHAVQERDVAHLIFPDDVQSMEAGPDAEASGPEGRLTPLEIEPPAGSLEAAASRLKEARRPAFIVGYGAREDMEAALSLADALHAPVITTFKAKGILPDDHPLACGVLGRSGTPVASHFMNEADLLVVLGASFSKHTGIAPGKPTIHVDLDPLALGRKHPVAVPVLGHIGVTARRLAERMGGGTAAEDRREEIAARREAWREEKMRRAGESRGRGLSSAAVFDVMSAMTPENAVIAVDVGSNTYSFGRYFECKRQAVLMSGYLGSIGFGYPAAMGAWAAAPGRPILAVTGDGGFAQYMGEVTTAVKYGMNITHVLLNNSELGKITREQREASLPVWQTSLVSPDFAGYARGCGALGIRAGTRDEFEAAYRKALDHDGPALVEIRTDPDLV